MPQPTELSKTDALRHISGSPPLPKAFFFKNTTQIAKDLLGKGLVIGKANQALLVEIVEVEAYLGKGDPASHSHCGPTKRNLPMFSKGGTCYVYLSYGINFCMNVVTNIEGIGEAVLLRAAAPIAGTEIMMANRFSKSSIRENSHRILLGKLLNGPGKLTKALGVDLRYNNTEFNQDDFKLIDLGKHLSSSCIGRSPRIGISKARTRQLRFFIKSSPWLSKKGS